MAPWVPLSRTAWARTVSYQRRATLRFSKVTGEREMTENLEENGCVAGIRSKTDGEAAEAVKGWDSEFCEGLFECKKR